MVSKIFFSSNLEGRIFFYSSARIFFYYICAACNFFLPKSACRKFFFKITHPLPQELNGRPINRLSHDTIALRCCSRRFDCYTASLHQAMRSVVYVSLFYARWFAVIGAFRSLLLFRLTDDVPSLMLQEFQFRCLY